MDPHVRYAGLVARQLAAILAEDLEAFNSLADQRELVASELQRLPRSDEDTARLALLEAVALDAQVLEVLRLRRDALRSRIRAEDSGTANALAYARAAAPAAANSFDVSL